MEKRTKSLVPSLTGISTICSCHFVAKLVYDCQSFSPVSGGWSSSSKARLWRPKWRGSKPELSFESVIVIY